MNKAGKRQGKGTTGELMKDHISVNRVREPANQYQFKEKQEYRESVWSTFAQNLIDVHNAKVLFFPGRHGLEIEVALSHGFKEENLIACEENAAILATAVWRKQYPGIRCYGNTLSRTIERLEKDNIILDAANLDYCSNLCTSVMDDLRKLLNSKIIIPNFVIAITLLKGRENKALIDVARLVFRESTGSVDRIDIIKSLMKSWDFNLGILLKSQYRSNTKNMTYGVFKIATADWIRDQYYEFFKSHMKEVNALLELDDCITTPQKFETFKILQDEFFDRRHILKEKYSEFQNSFNNQYPIGTVIMMMCERESAQRWCHLFNIGNRRHRQELKYISPWDKQRIEKLENELNKTRNLLVKSESEKAQLLQAGRAWR